MEDEIIIKDPNSKFNLFKRILAVIFGCLLVLPLIMMIVEREYYSVDEIISFESLMLVVFSCGLIYYGLRRSKIHKSCYFKFTDKTIEIRWQNPTPINNYSDTRQLNFMYRMLLKPEYTEINVPIHEIKSVNIGTLQIVVGLKSGGDCEIPLKDIEYKPMKRIKSNFQDVLKKINI